MKKKILVTAFRFWWWKPRILGRRAACAWRLSLIAYSLGGMAWAATTLSFYQSSWSNCQCSLRARARNKNDVFKALARVSFRAAKIVSCNNKKKINGLQSKLLQLFYFICCSIYNIKTWAPPTPETQNPLKYLTLFYIDTLLVLLHKEAWNYEPWKNSFTLL
jgi:hypothetical protein